MRYKYTLIFVYFLFTLMAISNAQNQRPLLLSLGLENNYNSLPAIELPPPDVKLLLEEDGIPNSEACALRSGKMIPVSFTFPGSMNTRIHGDDIVYSTSFHSEGATALALYFDKMVLPEGSSLFVYDQTETVVFGPYTARDIQASGRFATPPVRGDFITLEINSPAYNGEAPSVDISELAWFYRDNNIYKGFGNSGDCEVNVNCEEGSALQDEKKAILRIQVKVNGFTFWCSGTLINNTRNDGTPYVLTADHCAYKYGSYATPADLGQWVFSFDYESATCPDPAVEPLFYSLTGATKIASGGNHGEDGSDFYLVRLNLPVSGSYNPFFIGWDRSGQISSTGVSIHHPQGDIKKISTYTSSLVSSSWNNNGLPSHWKVVWSDTENGHGVTEGGSSGSPILNDEGLLIGTLTGGLSACDEGGGIGPNEPDYYGKFSYHWLQNGTDDTLRLAPWLDPDNSGISLLGGSYLGYSEQKSTANPFRVFPNPFYDNFSLNSDGQHVDHLTILNQFGVKMYEISYTNNQVSTAHFNALQDIPPGIYFLKILSGNKQYFLKIIKSS